MLSWVISMNGRTPKTGEMPQELSEALSSLDALEDAEREKPGTSTRPIHLFRKFALLVESCLRRPRSVMTTLLHFTSLDDPFLQYHKQSLVERYCLSNGVDSPYKISAKTTTANEHSKKQKLLEAANLLDDPTGYGAGRGLPDKRRR